MFELANKMVGIYKIKDITRTITIAPRKVTKYFQNMKTKILEAQENSKLAEEAKELWNQIAEKTNTKTIEEIKNESENDNIQIENSSIDVGIIQNPQKNDSIGIITQYEEVNKENIDINYKIMDSKLMKNPLQESISRSDTNKIQSIENKIDSKLSNDGNLKKSNRAVQDITATK